MKLAYSPRLAAVLMAVSASLVSVSSAFAQTATPPPSSPSFSVTASAGVLNSLGVLPVVTLAAVVGIAAMLYRRFRS